MNTTLPAALTALALLATGAGGFTPVESRAAAQEAATPRAPDGKPDLSGMWDGRDRAPAGGEDRSRMDSRDDSGNLTRLAASRRCAPNQLGCRENTNQNNDGELTGRVDTNRPLYKPEHWDQVQELDYNTNFVDPSHRCQPHGVPRIGPPRKIVQTAKEVIFFYGSDIQTAVSHDYRIAGGRGTRWLWTPSRSTTPHGCRRAAATSTATTFTSSNASGAKGTRSTTTSRLKTLACCSSRGC
jgi:hypothetical protein